MVLHPDALIDTDTFLRLLAQRLTSTGLVLATRFANHWARQQFKMGLCPRIGPSCLTLEVVSSFSGPLGYSATAVYMVFTDHDTTRQLTLQGPPQGCNRLTDQVFSL